MHETLQDSRRRHASEGNVRPKSEEKELRAQCRKKEEEALGEQGPESEEENDDCLME